MYNQNGLAIGAKWYFLLAIVVLAVAFALGINIKDAKWLNGEIASATANQMNVATDIDRQKAELELQSLRTQTEIQIAQQKRQAEYEAAKQQQELNALNLAASQRANFQAGLYESFNFGLKAVIATLCIALTIVGIFAGVGLYKVLNARALTAQSSQPSVVVVQKRQPSPAAQKARQYEREEREREQQLIDNRINQLFPDSETVWTAKGDKSENLKPGNYPWVV